MQMLQDGVYATAPEKPLRMTGTPEACRVRYHHKYIMHLISFLYILLLLLLSFREPVN